MGTIYELYIGAYFALFAAFLFFFGSVIKIVEFSKKESVYETQTLLPKNYQKKWGKFRFETTPNKKEVILMPVYDKP